MDQCPWHAPREDVRWQQRFGNYCRALEQLEQLEQLEHFLELPALNEREQQGLIKAFEYLFELAWNTLRDLLRSQGNASLLGSRDTLREAFRLGLIDDGEAWMLMIQGRNLTSHTYDRAMADAIASRIVSVHLPCYQALRSRLQQRLLQLLCQHSHVEALWLFGSRAMGRYRPGSDLDLCLDGEQLTHRDRLQLIRRLFWDTNPVL